MPTKFRKKISLGFLSRFELNVHCRVKMGNPVLKGWRYGAFIGAVVGCIGLAIYPVIISPYLFPEKWKQQSKAVRKQKSSA